MELTAENYLREWELWDLSRGDAELQIFGLKLMVRAGVFSPDPRYTNSTGQVAQYIPRDCSGLSVLDLGTGTGCLALLAAARGAATVLAIDRDPRAVENARENAARLGLERRVEVRVGDLFEGVQRRFDLVLANLPLSEEIWNGRAVHPGSLFARFFAGLDAQLRPEGRALVSFASFGESEAFHTARSASARRWSVHGEERFGYRWEVYESV